MPRTPFFPLLILIPLLGGCTSTNNLVIEYPIESSVAERINSAGGSAIITFADSQTVSAYSLRVDSVMAIWLGDRWTAAPIADIASFTIPDREGEESRWLKGILYGTAIGAALGLADGIIGDRSNVAGEVIATAAAGGLIAGLWLPQTHWPYVRLSIRPPRDEAERVKRSADRLRLQGVIPDILAGFIQENRRYRLEPGFLIGHGNGISPESDPSSLFAVGGRISFGYQLWERGEMAIEFSLLSHTFRRSTEQEQVTRAGFLLMGTLFPFSRSTVFLQGGVGYGFYSAMGTYTGGITTDPPVTPPLVSGDGPVLACGAGIEIAIAEQWSVRPGIRYTFTALGDLMLNDAALLATGKGSHTVAFSLGVVFRGI